MSRGIMLDEMRDGVQIAIGVGEVKWKGDIEVEGGKRFSGRVKGRRGNILIIRIKVPAAELTLQAKITLLGSRVIMRAVGTTVETTLRSAPLLTIIRTILTTALNIEVRDHRQREFLRQGRLQHSQNAFNILPNFPREKNPECRLTVNIAKEKASCRVMMKQNGLIS